MLTENKSLLDKVIIEQLHFYGYAKVAFLDATFCLMQKKLDAKMHGFTQKYSFTLSQLLLKNSF